MIPFKEDESQVDWQRSLERGNRAWEFVDHVKETIKNEREFQKASRRTDRRNDLPKKQKTDLQETAPPPAAVGTGASVPPSPAALKNPFVGLGNDRPRSKPGREFNTLRRGADFFHSVGLHPIAQGYDIADKWNKWREAASGGGSGKTENGELVTTLKELIQELRKQAGGKAGFDKKGNFTPAGPAALINKAMGGGQKSGGAGQAIAGTILSNAIKIGIGAIAGA